MAFLVKALFRWNEYSKNGDISVLSNFLAIFFELFSPHREILPSTICMPNFRSIGPFKQKLQRGGRICPLPTIPICKKPGLFRVNCFLQYDTSAGIQSLQTSIEIKLCQNYTDIYSDILFYPVHSTFGFITIYQSINVKSFEISQCFTCMMIL